ncbi:MAG: VOC family protein [Hyphomicrobiales bacterium]|nr:VOC family protein [Hyphomicrobiales bacterium]
MIDVPRFHLAIPVDNLEEARQFYTEILGCTVGREAERWIDFNFYGHQVSVHLRNSTNETIPTNQVDGETVPARHFGVILDIPSWERLRDQLQAKNITFLIQPQIRFKGKVGEQATMFFRDPSGNAIELKAFASDAQVFAT